ncbi:MAG: DUF1499 domain-containing protein [Hyphomicrobiaceae bacterium]
MERIDEQPQSRASTWALRLAVFAAALVVVTGILHRLFTMPTPVALNLFAVAFGLAALSLVMALAALYVTWGTGVRGGASAIAAIAVTAGLFAWPIAYLPVATRLPRLNDISTDTETPPPFARLSVMRQKGANAAAWRGPKTAERQKASYPDIAPLYLARRPDDAFELALEALRRQKMTIVAETRDPAGGGVVEAVDRTMILGFADDLAVRVRPDAGGSRVDVRSASRWGRHDLGRNAERVRRVLNQIVARAQATVPAVPGERVARVRARGKRDDAKSRAESGRRAGSATVRATRSQSRRVRRRQRDADE